MMVNGGGNGNGGGGSNNTNMDNILPRELTSQTPRRGKWSVEEERYTEKIIMDFENGTLDVPEGTTLRTYLAKVLNCDPMRITKKYTGNSSIGKRTFTPLVRSPENLAFIEMSQRDLEELRRTWINKLLLAEQWNNRKINIMKSGYDGLHNDDNLGHSSFNPDHVFLGGRGRSSSAQGDTILQEESEEEVKTRDENIRIALRPYMSDPMEIEYIITWLHSACYALRNPTNVGELNYLIQIGDISVPALYKLLLSGSIAKHSQFEQLQKVIEAYFDRMPTDVSNRIYNNRVSTGAEDEKYLEKAQRQQTEKQVSESSRQTSNASPVHTPSSSQPSKTIQSVDVPEEEIKREASPVSLSSKDTNTVSNGRIMTGNDTVISTNNEDRKSPPVTSSSSSMDCGGYAALREAVERRGSDLGDAQAGYPSFLPPGAMLPLHPGFFYSAPPLGPGGKLPRSMLDMAHTQSFNQYNLQAGGPAGLFPYLPSNIYGPLAQTGPAPTQYDWQQWQQYLQAVNGMQPGAPLSPTSAGGYRSYPHPFYALSSYASGGMAGLSAFSQNDSNEDRKVRSAVSFSSDANKSSVKEISKDNLENKEELSRRPSATKSVPLKVSYVTTCSPETLKTDSSALHAAKTQSDDTIISKASAATTSSAVSEFSRSVEYTVKTEDTVVSSSSTKLSPKASSKTVRKGEETVEQIGATRKKLKLTHPSGLAEDSLPRGGKDGVSISTPQGTIESAAEALLGLFNFTS
eukprot:scaffold1334_cov170-Ochromonas_danica.AAC.4